MKQRRFATRLVPYGLLVTHLLTQSCVLRIRSEDQSVGDGGQGTGTSDVASTQLGTTTGAPSVEKGPSDASSTSSASGLPSSETSSVTTSYPTSSAQSSKSSSQSTSAQDTSSETEGDPLIRLGQNVDRYITNYMRGDELRRMRGDVLVAYQGTPASHRSYQEAPNQRYAYGSITKTMTAVAVLQLEQAGKLKRSDAIDKFITELPESFRDITIEQLLSHRSGLGNYLADEDALDMVSTEQSRDAMIERISKKPPTFTPGSDASYSNSGYYLLGIVIERVSEQSLSGYFQSHIFGPANMKHTSMWDDNIALGNRPEDGKAVAAPRMHPSVTFSAGAAHGTSKDLAAFGQALVNGTLLPKSIFTQMITPKSKLGNIDYGLGVLVGKLPSGKTFFGHNGATLGSQSGWLMTQDGKWTSVVLSNMFGVDAFSIAADTLSMALTGQYIEPPQAKKAVPFDPALAKALAGEYAIVPAQLPSLEKELPAATLEALKTLTWSGETKYMVKLKGSEAFEVKQVAKDEFFHQDAQLTLKIQRKDNAITGLTLIQGPFTIDYLRHP